VWGYFVGCKIVGRCVDAHGGNQRGQKDRKDMEYEQKEKIGVEVEVGKGWKGKTKLCSHPPSTSLFPPSPSLYSPTQPAKPPTCPLNQKTNLVEGPLALEQGQKPAAWGRKGVY
jgi:hypothetical protein